MPNYYLLSVRNPFLLAVYNPIFAILTFDGSGLHSQYITTRVRLRNGKTDELLRRKHFRNDLEI